MTVASGGAGSVILSSDCISPAFHMTKNVHSRMNINAMEAFVSV